MGDHADDCMEACEDFEYNRSMYRSGMLSHDDAYYAGVIDESGCEQVAGCQQPVTCRHCHKRDLHWCEVDGNWLLHDDNGIHNCPKKPRKTVTCKYCDKSGLSWTEVSGKWVLFDNDNLHNCPARSVKLPKLRSVGE